MMGTFSLLRLTFRLATWATPKIQSWSLERNWNRAEGERNLKARNYSEAERYLSLAAIEAEEHGGSVTKRIHLRLQLADAQRKRATADPEHVDQSKLSQAEKTVRAAIELAARASDRTGYVQCLDALADIFTDQIKFAAVEKVTQEAIRIEASLPHPDPLRMARRVHRLGMARHKSGQSESAVPAMENAVALHEQAYGEDHLETGRLLTDLGCIYRAQGNHVEAQRCLHRALRIHENQCGYESPEAIRDLHNLAGSYEEAGDVDSAAAQYERALTYKGRVVGGSLDEMAQMQYGLAGLYIGWQNYSRARELLAEAIGTFKRKGGTRLATAHETLGYVEEWSGRYHDAVKELALAGKVWEKCGPEHTKELIANLQHRIELLEQLRRKGEAKWLRDRIVELTPTLPETTAAETVPEIGLSEAELSEGQSSGSATVDAEPSDSEPAETTSAETI